MSVTSATSSTNWAQLRQLRQAEMFKTADADGDGQLSQAEFQSIGQNVQGSGGESRGPPPMRGGGGPGGQFGGDTLSSLLATQSVDDVAGSVMSAGDADGDGLLTASEISTALAANAPDAVKGQGLEDKMASDIVSALDSDGDGSLSTEEISSAISSASANQSTHAMRGPPPGPPPSEGAEASSGSSSSSGSSGVFEGLDTNQDGVVSAEELAVAGGSDATSAAADLMQKLLAQLDTALTSSDGKASNGTSVTA